MSGPRWRAASNGSSRLRWFVLGEVPGGVIRYHEGTDGRLIRFGSYETATRAANRLNDLENSDIWYMSVSHQMST
jgi:hypothetical protein